MTYKRVGEKNELLVYDLKGQLLKQTLAPIAEKNPESFYPYAIRSNTIFQLVERFDDENSEIWALTGTKIEN